MANVDVNALTGEEFSLARKAPFEEIVGDAVTMDRLRARRLVLEGRVAQAALDSIRWTKIGVFLALLSSGASLVIATLDLLR
jgi:hypothetical protein